MICSQNDQDDRLRHLLEQALLLPKQRYELLQQQEVVRQILNSVPTRRWLYEVACQTSNRKLSIKVRSLIVELMQSSGSLKREKVSVDDYEEARARTWEWFGKNLHKYDPEQASFMTWFNNKLAWTIRTVIQERMIEAGRRTNLHTFPIDNIPNPPDFTENQLFLEQMLEIVQRDPDKKLSNCRMQKFPTITCQKVILAVLESRWNSPNIPWDELGKIFEVDKKCLQDFCRRNAFPCFTNFCRRHNLLNP